LYDEILLYEELLDKKEDNNNKHNKYLMIDISGRGRTYIMNEANPHTEIVKVLVVGNASNTNDKDSTFASFSVYATIKLMLTMMGAPTWIRSWMQPVQELYLIMDDMELLKSQWGITKLQSTQKEYARMFCQAAKTWIRIRTCHDEKSIQAAYTDILDGTVPPSEAIVVDVAHAVAHRKA
jgi:hypothetical protein